MKAQLIHSAAGEAQFETIHAVRDEDDIQHVQDRLSWFERAMNQTWVRRMLVIVAMVVCWQGYASYLNDPLMLPSFIDTIRAMVTSLASGELISRTASSIRMLLAGYAVRIVLATILTVLAVSTRVGNDFLSTLTAMLNPLPAIALLPLALLWLGLGAPSVIFVLVHSVLWPVSLNMHSGFLGVSETLRMAGQNYGLKGLRFVWKILIPAAFPSILTGLKVGWAFAWRTLIAAELVFGTSGGNGGLGWFIFESRNTLSIDKVFAGLMAVVIIGLVVEGFIFRTIENATVRKWGMQRH